MVQSSIVVPTTGQKRTNDEGSKDTQPTEEIKRPRIQESEAGQKRNRRLFGSLLGTLNKFKDETEKNSEIDKNRQAINEKLHEKLERERAQLQEKLRERKEQKIKLAEEKLEKEKQLWQKKTERLTLAQNERLANFLKTATQPSLYYLPQKLTDDMQEKIKQQKEEALEAKRKFEGQNGDDRLSDHEDEEVDETKKGVAEDRLSDHEAEEKDEKTNSEDTNDKVDQEAAKE
ncbi:hypothetical protein INT46_011648 [Mucor plumbeus]|uniref:Pinin/SDK/MemA protein domain-containing protein n=1 Tax=Mucor plumbeus TaxID=97098 RepID=A0A8H7QGC9_9FUNG|nr:hypothetical protein INT46_011648 [Mucor plumbeus]